MKKIILIVLLLLLTGCKVEYKINLNNNFDIEENINILSTTEEDKNKIEEFSLNIPIDQKVDDYGAFENKVSTIEYYNYLKNKDMIIFKNKYNNNKYDKYIDSTLANLAYEYVSINKVDEKNLILSTSKEFLLFNNYNNLEEVKITITTNYKVLSNNADIINNHDYTWVITKDNAYGKGIFLKVDTSKEDLTFLEKLMRGDYLNIFTLSLLIAIIALIIYLLVKRRNKKVNAI